MFNNIVAALKGELTGGLFTLEAANGGITYAPPHDADVPQDVLDKLEETRRRSPRAPSNRGRPGHRAARVAATAEASSRAPGATAGGSSRSEGFHVPVAPTRQWCWRRAASPRRSPA